MERTEALARLRELEGSDLRPLADRYGVTVWTDGGKNKGWAGQVIERHLGMNHNCSQSPDFGTWELKVIPLKRNRAGALRVKETMAITMIDPEDVVSTPFENSHLLAKLRCALVCARIFEAQSDDRSVLHRVATFDLDDPSMLERVRLDYELVRETISTVGFHALSGSMGILVQPRTKGPGHGSISRAFYARTGLVAGILGLAG